MIKSKGSYGYIESRRLYTLLRSILFFAISASLFFAGLYATKTRTNLLTVVAVLGVLPAAKSLVECFMLFRSKPCPANIYELTKDGTEGGCLLYDLYFTAEKAGYPVYSAYIKAGSCLVLTGGAAYRSGDVAAHVDYYLKKNSVEGIVVKVYDRAEDYLERIGEMHKLADNADKSEKAALILKNISL